MTNSILLTKHFKLILLLLSLSYLSSYAQESIPVVPNPDTWSYMQFRERSSVNHFYGEVEVSIPLYTYEDHDFRIPISISYGTAGWLANIEAGIIGKNWKLNLGGYVSRTVRGLPDDRTLDVPKHISDLLPAPYAAQKYKYYGYAHAYTNSVATLYMNSFTEANHYPHPFPIMGNGWGGTYPGKVGEL